MKTVFSFFATIMFSLSAMPQTAAELTCRAQAKEIALQTYSSCITEARNTQVEEIRKNYQKELADLKSKYDKELKKMGNGSAKKTSKAPPAAREVQAPVPTKGIAKQLPGKPQSSEAIPVQTVTEGTKVVAVGSEEADGLEQEAADADQVEIIDMPVE
ncbi:hypothetical protein AB1A81_10055 [Bdellovibrio bacteriovorus]|uniref:Uncharacterized protein n=1 Tax=Bdellovibrio bacteriovorus (strain ATCC 15356 / DSM 50701 / NCIMB 9529 / HD100) TaxID=264462 RepID=Q6ML27_BDEBA|nr:hypothetical protein [Bdellovibrio bacteriovorus]AHZ84734.1 hypothetical protein EP01_07255 [Bdellovibrio bacteriovorus]BEV68621.1 hypothetical protein Bb109J_c2041 [Bdellovibrio bacteriovorus]CAE80030.1 hypothetical protein predicted by Glimmer/Critica [Bdellovibrio bacteriovorus HD100]